ncbi:MAG: glycine--tRNA ligase subunit beta, partial [Acetobacteraceae bacterium]|nr:glycine--tRNA ligase subunit beta [Acetobacteraceae bacterium]
MPELLLELFSEEIPARLQARAAEDLKTRVERELAVAPLALEGVRVFSGPRRITLVGYLPSTTPASSEEFRGPRKGAPRPAIAGFLDTKVIQPLSLPGGKLEKAIEALEAGSPYDDFIEPAIWPQASMSARAEWRDTGKGEFLYATVERPPRPAKDILCDVLPYVIRTFPWPKSMRWGNSTLTWVRPLQRILCLLDGEIVPFDLRHGEDDGHGLASGDLTEGHRIMAPGAFAVRSFAEYEAGLRERKVILDAEERARLIRDGIAGLAAREGLQVVADEGLLAEVAGLVEWPVPLLGRIDGAFMDLPVEVMRTTMRVNQRYFTLRHPDGSAAPRFALVANIEPSDSGAAVIGGNERVLRARLADARFFWDQDRKHKLEDFLPKLEDVVFHAKLGTQGERVRRLEKLAALIAPMVGADPVLAARAARLAKADLASGMVGEFPELQGIMGRYYALHGGEDPRVAEAIAAHYRPLGPADDVPREPVAIAVALADKLDQLAGFFAVGEKPTGSGDPFALRRAALGVIRIIRENGLRLGLRDLIVKHWLFLEGDIVAAWAGVLAQERLSSGDVRPSEEVLGAAAAEIRAKLPNAPALAEELSDFIAERLRIQLRSDSARHDVVAAVFGAAPDDDLVRLLARAEALRVLIESPDGANLLTAYRRAANILRIEDRKDGPHRPPADPALLRAPEEIALA